MDSGSGMDVLDHTARLVLSVRVSRETINRISAAAPVAMSLAAFVLVVLAVAGGARREPDEGTGAHIFQLLIAGQLPFVLAFLATADWDRWQRVAGPLALQVGALALAFAPVAYFNL